MNYKEFDVDVTGKPAHASEIVVAFLSDAGFDSFTEEHRMVRAYVLESVFDKNAFVFACELIKSAIGSCEIVEKQVPIVNWNEEWESNFSPVTVNNFCEIRAPFHQANKLVDYDIVIAPKMSFGTGHHETTYLMLEYMSKIAFSGKSVADCGSGTGVLAIVAEKCGANSVFAFDNDELCSVNAHENAVLNNCKQISIDLGGFELLKDKKFDILLANINRNILTQNMELLSSVLNPGGILLTSGFYEKDAAVVEKYALKNGFNVVYLKVKNNWTILVFSK